MKAIILTLVISLTTILTIAQNKNVQTIPAQQFKQLIDTEQGIILDVRTPEEVNAGHIPGASVINFYDENFEQKIKLIQKDKNIYVYCKGGGRSSEAAKILAANGFKHIYNLEGGMMSWEKSKFPVTKPTSETDTKIQELSLDAFKEVLQKNFVVLSDFHTVWCAPCKKMAPVVDSLETQFKDMVKIMRVDIDKSKQVATDQKIEGIPVFVIYQNGLEVWRQKGIISKEELEEAIRRYI